MTVDLAETLFVTDVAVPHGSMNVDVDVGDDDDDDAAAAPRDR